MKIELEGKLVSDYSEWWVTNETPTMDNLSSLLIPFIGKRIKIIVEEEK